MHGQKAGDNMTITESGPCWVCGAVAMGRCDAPGCVRWLCYDHAAVEAQPWDVAGWDGVDIRCQEHRTLDLLLLGQRPKDRSPGT